MSFRADLHCHTHYSDGSDSCEQILEKAKAIGLSGFAITDHDTVSAYPEALPIAKKLGMPLLSGVEFSASFRKEPVDILGYGFSLKSKALLDFCQFHRKRRIKRNRAILDKLRPLGIDIEESELETVPSADLPPGSLRTIGRPHIAQVLVRRGLVKSVKEAFALYLGEGKVAFDPEEKPTIETTIAAIHEGGGFAVLAHPHLIRQTSLVREILSFPFDGIEGYYAVMEPKREARWIEEGKKRGWLVTGGSDYHGTIKPYISLGASWVGQEVFEVLYNRFLSHGDV